MFGTLLEVTVINQQMCNRSDTQAWVPRVVMMMMRTVVVSVVKTVTAAKRSWALSMCQAHGEQCHAGQIPCRESPFTQLGSRNTKLRGTRLPCP